MLLPPDLAFYRGLRLGEVRFALSGPTRADGVPFAPEFPAHRNLTHGAAAVGRQLGGQPRPRTAGRRVFRSAPPFGADAFYCPKNCGRRAARLPSLPYLRSGERDAEGGCCYFAPGTGPSDRDAAPVFDSVPPGAGGRPTCRATRTHRRCAGR